MKTSIQPQCSRILTLQGLCFRLNFCSNWWSCPFSSWGKFRWIGAISPWNQPTRSEHFFSAPQLAKWVLLPYLFIYEASVALKGKITIITYTFKGVLITDSSISVGDSPYIEAMLGHQPGELQFNSILTLPRDGITSHRQRSLSYKNPLYFRCQSQA